ncbi:transcriptional regulator BetI [Xenorhabdus nematophila]|uniref:HTH-type transcriptional regulator BetI n=1 Tax=Xenorhabdus nematophila (strain ATCC 19061 / DSM 3370 / CCUG 14189 / LMG 1036 / NCIMB 9965 / AN6) TaxID=406817 RepID=D3V9S9_XENNA|nr:transcriptional regulator BetI [Xenorhabdus nematophila]CEE95027.1 transcriptional repressor for the cellular response to osmotic stress (TetR/AcrR family) [Xenorhabdus nematophila str. Anatoliense]CEF31669.1 transcriptional repressor for the cellular response to osmotic stress (TetR/AcrR family) [Xenorhabdus nematophila str. Websteri]AYA39549.1 transcriptional regulator BetI [Xenorhabdus nematophila]KHD28129.1 BetI family transcriptional regulator [Xenorhabdus nematophila]MBA0018113.1 tran
MPKIGMQSIRKQQLIDATLTVVNEIGMQEASIAQIARKAGVSNGIISHYFKDKNGLLEATMRYLLNQLGMAVARRLRLLDNATPAQRLKAIVEGNFDSSQTSSAAMKTWLAFWASSIHQPNLYRLQQVNERRLYSNICVEFRRALPKTEARLAAQGLAALIDGIWLRSALTSKPFDIEGAFKITIDYIEQKLGTSHIT